MSNLLVMSEKVNALGEKITHFSKRYSLADVSYNHSDREIAIMINDQWIPVDRFDEKESEVAIKTKIAKALNCLADAVRVTDTFDQKWDKFILAYDS